MGHYGAFAQQGQTEQDKRISLSFTSVETISILPMVTGAQHLSHTADLACLIQYGPVDSEPLGR